MNNFVFICIQSFKGGVGKTTVALNLAKVLQKKNYIPFVFDLDFTGTNITDTLDSPFWQNIVHIIEYWDSTKNGSKVEQANLLKLFERKFMYGLHIPIWAEKIKQNVATISFNSNLINVFGSQLYDLNNGKIDYFSRTNILYDNLHIYFLLDYIRELTHSISLLNLNKPIAIIFDTSPGYSGLIPHLNEWLLNLGPKQAKFCIVSSIDFQDIKTSLQSIEILTNYYKKKNTVSEKFTELINQKDYNTTSNDILIDDKKFFLNLVESYNDKKSDNLSFYLNEHQEGSYYLKHPNSFISWIINKIPETINNDMFSIDTEKLHFDDNISKNSVYTSLIKQNLGNPKKTNLIFYNPNIELQFVQNLIKINKNKFSQRRRIICNKLDESLFLNVKYIGKEIENLLSSHRLFSEKLSNKLFSYIVKFQVDLNSLETLLYEYGFSFIRKLVKKEWQPAYFNYELTKLFTEIYPNYTIKERFSTNDLEFLQSDIKTIIKKFETSQYINNEVSRIQNFEEFSGKLIIFQNSFMLTLLLSLTGNYNILKSNKEFDNILSICFKFPEIQNKHWSARSKANSKLVITEFLTQDKLQLDEINNVRIEKKEKRDLENIHILSNLYRKFSQAQARLIDLAPDAEFLVYILEDVILKEMKTSIILPSFEKTINEVIISKQITHINGKSILNKLKNEVHNMDEFERVLKVIVKSWKI